MSIANYLRTLTAHLAKVLAQTSTTRPTRHLPRLEILEERAVPAVITWTGAAPEEDDRWHNPLNWDLGRRPGADDDVVIPDLTDDVIIRYIPAVGAFDSIKSLVSHETLDLFDGRLTLTGTGSQIHGSIINRGADLIVEQELTINGFVHLTTRFQDGGPMSGPGVVTIAEGGELRFTDMSMSNLTVENAGLITVSGSSGNVGWNNVTVNNTPTGVIRLDGTQGVVGSGTINNAGLLTKHRAVSGTDTSLVSISGLSLNNSGVVESVTGTLNLIGPATHTGQVLAQGTATVRFSSNPHTFEAGTTLFTMPGGTIQFSGGQHILKDGVTLDGLIVNDSSGRVLVSNNGRLEIQGNVLALDTTVELAGGFLLGDGTLSVGHEMLWGAGTLDGTGRVVIESDATLRTVGDPGNMLRRTIDNHGTLIFSADASGLISLTNGATINNLSDGVVDAQNEANLSIISNSTGATFNNAGTFRRTGSTGILILESVPFHNTGTVEVDSAQLRIGKGSGSGTYHIGEDSLLRFFNGSTVTLADGTTFTGAGDILVGSGTTWDINGLVEVGPDLTLTLDTSGTISGSGEIVIAGDAILNASIMNGTGATTIASGGTLTINNTQGRVIDRRTLNNSGTIITTGNAAVQLRNGAVINNLNGGVFDSQANHEIQTSSGAVGTFNNAGTLIKSAGTGSTSFRNVDFTNTGTVDIQTGTLNFISRNFLQTDGITILHDSRLLSSSILLQGGTVEGNGTLQGTVNNSGATLAPGFSTGQINITGNYIQGPGGQVTLEIGGLTQADRDHLAISGSANLNGTLTLDLVDGFVLGNDTTLVPITFASRTGTFATINQPSHPSVAFDVAYTSTQVNLTTVMTSSDSVTINATTEGQWLTPIPFTILVDGAAPTDVFTFVLDWNGDGTVLETVQGTSGITLSHVWQIGGEFTVKVTAIGATGSIALGEQTLILDGPDQEHGTASQVGENLLITGTNENDVIHVRPGRRAGEILVQINNRRFGPFTPTGRLVIAGLAGDDTIHIHEKILLPAEVNGGAGNDRIFGGGGDDALFGGVGDDLIEGGGGNNVLIGGAGNDLLLGGRDRDVLIGGQGSDLLLGGGGEDLLIGGFTAFDLDLPSLAAIRAEWTASRSYDERVANLRGTGTGPRANDDVFLIAGGVEATVQDDDSTDLIVGNRGRDWFFANLDSGVLDILLTLSRNETNDDPE